MPQSLADQFKSIPMSPNLGESLKRAHGFAREQAHRALLLEHLLLALTEDPDAAVVLRTCNVDLDRLGTDVSGYLGRLLEDMRAPDGAEPRVDPELLRVLQAAGQAAQQSRRRQIDGAIVLAAVVGDGKSPAAGLLKAHGLTFEGAIRALQKATAQARSKQFATHPAPAPPDRPATAHIENTPPVAAGESAAPASLPAPGAVQSVEDILAAARTRIQQRAAAIVGKADSNPPAETPPPAEPDTLALSNLSSLTASPAPAPPEPSQPADNRAEPPADPAAPAAPAGGASASTPPPRPPAPAAPPQLAARLPQTTPRHAPPPFPQRPPPSNEDGPPRPPPPRHAATSGPAQPGPPNRQTRPVAPNGAMAGAHRAPAEVTRPAARQGSPSRSGQRSAGGPLVETIPRRLRLGVPAPAQVRIGRDKIDGLILLLLGGRGTAPRPDAFVTRALSVRLKAPDGGFWIEATSPETQWVESAPGLQQDEHVSWRWTVTPQRRGRGRLLLVVTARTVGRDGLAAETAPPDRVIEVTVRGSKLRRAGRWIAYLTVLLLGAALGWFGQDLWDAGLDAGPTLLKSLLGG